MHYWFSTSEIEKQLLYAKICFSGVLPSVLFMFMQHSIYIEKEFHTRLKRKKKKSFIETLGKSLCCKITFERHLVYFPVLISCTSLEYLNDALSLPCSQSPCWSSSVVPWVSFRRSLEYKGSALRFPESNCGLCERHQSSEQFGKSFPMPLRKHNKLCKGSSWLQCTWAQMSVSLL